jgi:hypothetical protein
MRVRSALQVAAVAARFAWKKIRDPAARCQSRLGARANIGFLPFAACLDERSSMIDQYAEDGWNARLGHNCRLDRP